MNDKQLKKLDLIGGLFLLAGLLALTIAVLFTPAFVVKFLLADHNITSGGVEQLDRYRSFLAFGGGLSFLFGFHLALEPRIKLTPGIRRRLFVGMLILICFLGAFLRIFFYSINRSLWIDEAMLALNIVNRSFTGLFRPLDLNQGAPLGFLLAEKLVTLVLGGKDYILRIIPLISGVVSLPLVYLVSKKYLGRLAVFLTLLLFALSSRLIYYSSEVKQYSSDVLAALVLLLVAPKLFDEEARPGSFVLLGGLGVLTLFFSHPSVFVFAGILLTAGVFFIARRDWISFLWLIGIGLVWSAFFGLDYLINLRYSASNPYLIDYWRGSYAPLPPWNNLKWYAGALTGMLKDPATLPVNLVTLALLVVGFISIGLRRWQKILLLLFPFLMALIASALGKYPFSGRLILFLVPFLYFILAEGLERFGSLVRRINPHLAWFLTAFLVMYFLSSPGSVAYNNVKSPPMGQDIRPVMLYVGQHELPSDLFYVYHGALPAYRFYAPSIDRMNDAYLVGVTSIYEPEQYLQQIDRIGSNQRVWFVFSNNCSGCMVNEQEYILDYLDKVGTKLDQYEAVGASAYLYEIGKNR